MSDEPPFEVDAEALKQFDATAAQLKSQGVQLYRRPILRTLSMMTGDLGYDPGPSPTVMYGFFSVTTIRAYLRRPKGVGHDEAWDATIIWLIDEGLVTTRYCTDNCCVYYGLTADGKRFCESELISHA